MGITPVAILRTATPGARPTSHSYGSPYVNHADAQFGVVDSNGNAFDLLAVRNWSAAASYKIGDFVTTNGFLYRAIAASVPGPFLAANWSQMQSAANIAGAYLPLTGGTLTGTLTVNATVQATGPITSAGPAAFLSAYDRGNGGGNPAASAALYRDANIGRLWMSEVGDIFRMDTAGNASFSHALTVSGHSYIYGSATVYQATTHNPLTIQTDSGYNSAIVYYTPGLDEWLCGPIGTSLFYIYDASVGGAKLYCSSTQVVLNGDNFLAQGANCQVTAGASGHWDAGTTFTASPQASGFGSGGCFTAYGYAQSQACYVARIDTWVAYIMYFLYGGSSNPGSITANASNTFYNTSCDARLKDNIRPLNSEIDVGSLIDRLKPSAFEWKEYRDKTVGRKGIRPHDPMTSYELPPEEEDIYVPATTGHGFVAQELYEVLPDIVHHPNEGTWQADYSKLVPYLVAEIQNLRARLAKVEGK